MLEVLVQATGSKNAVDRSPITINVYERRKKLSVLKYAMTAAIFAISATRVNAQTFEERFADELRICTLTVGGGEYDAWLAKPENHDYCMRYAFVRVYVDSCVALGNGRWLNWGLRSECVEKAHKLIGD
jgi:hypothetical protein